MAQSDVNLIFSNAQAITATAASTGFYDAAEGLMLTGSTYTNPLTDQVWGTATYFGSELGVGDEKLPFLVYTGSTAWTTGTGVTIDIQCAVDNGGGTRSGLTFTTAVSSGEILTALLTAYTKIWAPWWPHRKVFAAATNGSVPRFYQINYTVDGSNFATAAITAAVAQTRDDNAAVFYGPGFTVGA